MYFYSPSTKGFYTESVHGARKLSVLDKDYEHPMIEVPNPNYNPEDNNSVAILTLPDPDFVPPIHSIDNPASAIPADAVEVSIEEHRALMDAQALGMSIVWDAELLKPIALTSET